MYIFQEGLVNFFGIFMSKNEDLGQNYKIRIRYLYYFCSNKSSVKKFKKTFPYQKNLT